MLELLSSGMSVVFAPKMFILIIFAVFLGTLFGALPGVSAMMAVTLGIPFTYKMDPVSAIAFLVAIYCASITGGGMTAILFKIPGVPSSAPTTYDGYPMAQRGEAGRALGTICESNLRRAFTIASGDTLLQEAGQMMLRPVTGIIMLICVAVLLSPVVKPWLQKRKAQKAEKSK